MKEYKIIHRKFSWRNGREKFQDEINNHAKQGWRVVNIYSISDGYVEALLEKDKNR
ncbi:MULTISPECIES: DUF4177 domain-containing protein [unclassified Tenacibaculum]|uniref:DUF4177 domain-containing protein n=1 Tax=Tenacibaculum TaxID=104267 RepID=UPI001F25135E|nr:MULTISPECIES: DUF4177 domain-containing protein [unclassified Tenacibaculum]MCF2876283.1 DUF4177 domain-containing protein [Tenacibaculum sp. Cn5-1]MCF2936358.1 DUF4177 domain-containing protein [Tenacibaculum sp. Cn5-34]MCG7511701.1 DUF4177 domain-containing protein [Tenacibaculum sp. Cn5-46]